MVEASIFAQVATGATRFCESSQ